MELRFIDKSLYLPEKKILVVADLHIGYEEGLEEQGILIPRFQFKQVVSDLERIFRKIGRGKVKEVVILGDLKHEFSGILKQEWKETLDLLDYLESKVGRKGKIILIKGNHDTILEPLAKRKKLKVKDYYVKGDVVFLHGHKSFPKCLDKKIKTLILGHLHPAITIREGAKSEIYKCFLVGKWKGKEVVILPSFFPLIEGQDVGMEKTNLASEFNFKLKNFEVYVPIDVDEVLDFGKLKKVGRLVE